MPDNPTPPVQPATSENQVRTWNMLCHMSALAGLVVPFGNLLGPLIVWQIKKNEIPSVETHGKAALNFQLTVVIAVLVSMFAGLLLAIIGIGFLLMFAAMALHLCGIIFAIIAGIKVNEGKEYRYPYTLELIK
jgi:uncharacterized Tic20 family protein